MNRELNIDDYVRTKDGTIGKIIAIDLAKPRQEKFPNHPSKNYWRDKILISCYRGWRTLQNIEKISSNIVDLIEVGDILEVKDMLGNISKVEVDENFELLTGTIVAITTHEQYEVNKYKIGE